MDTRELELRQAILAEPDDDGPRLVYADWLLENGDYRGEFVHAQVQLARTPPTSEGWWDLSRRVEAFLDPKTVPWSRGLPKVKGVAWGIDPSWTERRDTFARGIVERATFPNCTTFDRSFDEVWQHTPLRHVRINKWSDTGIASFFRPEVRERIRGIWLTWDGFDSACTRVPTFFEAADIDGLDSLRMFDRMIRREGWDAFLACKLPSLRWLELVHNQPYELEGPIELLGELVGASRLDQLEHLAIEQGAVNDAEVSLIASSSAASSLRSLSLAGNVIGDPGVAALANSRNLGQVGSLSLAHNPVRAAGLAALAKAESLVNLRRLDLESVPLDRAGAEALADAKSLTSLHELQLRGCGLDDELAEILAGSRALGNLRSLDLRTSGMSDAGLTELVMSPALANLRHVRVDDNQAKTLKAASIRDRFPHYGKTSRTGVHEFATEAGYVP